MSAHLAASRRLAPGQGEEGEEELFSPRTEPSSSSAFTTRPLSRRSRRSSTSFILPSLSSLSHRPILPAVTYNTSSTTVVAAEPMPDEEASPLFFPDFKDANQPPLNLTLCRPNGLLPCPPGPGWSVEVNDLLIQHPDKLKVEAGQQQWKMITCRLCGKTYDGKNGRSVARRHLQDKHGMPLAIQSRRSRWDLLKSQGGESKETLKEKNLKRKRPSASLQQASLEKRYSTFLEKFGPSGVFTPFGTTLVSPKFRNSPGAAGKGKKSTEEYLDGGYGKVVIPEEIINAVAAISEDILLLKESNEAEPKKARDGEDSESDRNASEKGEEMSMAMSDSTSGASKAAASSETPASALSFSGPGEGISESLAPSLRADGSIGISRLSPSVPSANVTI